VTPPARRPTLATASQTAGPFFEVGFAHLRGDRVMVPNAGESAVVVSGRVFDGNGEPVPDAALEIWQADANGAYDDRGARGFGRVFPKDDGRFTFTTIRPGPSAGVGAAPQAPHLVVTLFMRGLLKHLVTRMYFPEDPRNDADAILGRVPPDRRGTLIARVSSSNAEELVWDIVLQGVGETAFFEL